MNNVSRLLEKFPSQATPLWVEGRICQTSAEKTGTELVAIYADAKRMLERLTFVCAEIEALLAGPTKAELAVKIAVEDADPEPSARSHGWKTEKELKESLAAEGHPFAHWIHNNQTIVRVKHDSLPRHHKDRHHSAFDWLEVADSWAEALKKERQAEQQAHAKRVKEMWA